MSYDPFESSRSLALQIAALDWHQQRELFRRLHHDYVRRTENLPQVGPDGRYLSSEGKPMGMATGMVKGPSREEIEQFWGDSEPAFTHAEGDGRLGEELKDLKRDADRFTLHEQVKFMNDSVDPVVVESFTPSLPDFSNEAEIDAAIQAHIRRQR